MVGLWLVTCSRVKHIYEYDYVSGRGFTLVRSLCTYVVFDFICFIDFTPNMKRDEYERRREEEEEDYDYEEE